MRTFNEFKNEPWEHDFRTHPARAPLEAVLIETRPDPDLRYALTNFSCHVPYAALTILGSKENFKILKEIIGPDTNIRIGDLGLEGAFTLTKFNDLLTTPQFWDQFHGDRVLFFMTDTGLRKNDVLRFLKYDWVGAPWHHFPVGDPRVFQGNGALSIRNPKILKIFCKNFQRGALSEDVFFSACMVLGFPGASLPTRGEATKFSMEGTVYPDTFGFHNTHSYIAESGEVWGGHEGPTRRLVTIHEARADGHDVTDLVRLGIGAECLRIGPGALIHLGAKKLVIDGAEWDLEDGYVKDEIVLLPNEAHHQPHEHS
jgi:hypothetical protein